MTIFINDFHERVPVIPLVTGVKSLNRTDELHMSYSYSLHLQSDPFLILADSLTPSSAPSGSFTRTRESRPGTWTKIFLGAIPALVPHWVLRGALPAESAQDLISYEAPTCQSFLSICKLSCCLHSQPLILSMCLFINGAGRTTVNIDTPFFGHAGQHMLTGA